MSEPNWQGAKKCLVLAALVLAVLITRPQSEYQIGAGKV